MNALPSYITFSSVHCILTNQNSPLCYKCLMANFSNNFYGKSNVSLLIKIFPWKRRTGETSQENLSFHQLSPCFYHTIYVYMYIYMHVYMYIRSSVDLSCVNELSKNETVAVHRLILYVSMNSFTLKHHNSFQN